MTPADRPRRRRSAPPPDSAPPGQVPGGYGDEIDWFAQLRSAPSARRDRQAPRRDPGDLRRPPPERAEPRRADAGRRDPRTGRPEVPRRPDERVEWLAPGQARIDDRPPPRANRARVIDGEVTGEIPAVVDGEVTGEMPAVVDGVRPPAVPDRVRPPGRGAGPHRRRPAEPDPAGERGRPGRRAAPDESARRTGRADRAPVDRAAMDRAAVDRAAVDRARADRARADQVRAEPPTAGQPLTDRPAPDAPPPGRNRPGREGPGREGSAREGSAREGSAREGPGREGPAREGAGRETPRREAPGRDGPRRAGPGREEPGRSRPRGEPGAPPVGRPGRRRRAEPADAATTAAGTGGEDTAPGTAPTAPPAASGPRRGRAQARAQLREVERLRMITLICVTLVLLGALPGFFFIKYVTRDPGFRAMDGLAVPTWAARNPVDQAVGSRWCIQTCRVRHRLWESDRPLAPTLAAYQKALTDDGWKRWHVADCPVRNVRGNYTCWRRDAYTLDLWVRAPQCRRNGGGEGGADTDTGGNRCPASIVTVVIRNAGADDRLK